jgi:ribosomal protein S18 acetylase RimI-like enzyme
MIRPYELSDTSALLAIIDLHTPTFFAPSEKEEFVKYLEKEIEDYFVIEINGKVIGAGGINYFADDKKARISWDMIHPDFQGQGLGAKLLKHRIEIIKRNPEIKKIIVRTSQLVFSFYQKNGFALKSIEKDFWDQGFDLYLMEYEN